MKAKETEIAPLIKAYILIDQINLEKNINNAVIELKKMSKMYGDEFIKNINLISFNHVNFKNLGSQENERESFFTLNFLDFLENENFIKIFANLLMDAKIEYSVSEIFNGLNKKFNLNIEQQIKVVISFIDSGVEKYFEDSNLLFLEKCKEVYEQKLFLEFKNNLIVEKMISILFNILKIKNRQDNANSNTENKSQNDIDESNIQIYIQAFSHCNEQLKSILNNKNNIVNNENEEQTKIESNNNIINNENEEKTKIESNNNILNNNDENIKIEIEKILYELGPLIINQNFNLSDISYFDMNLDLNRMSKLILFIVNNHEFILSKHIKYLNKIFLLSMNKEIEYKNIIDPIPINNLISWDISSIYNLFQNCLNNIDKKMLLLSFDNPNFMVDNKNKFDVFSQILQKFHFFGENNNINDIQFFFDNFIFTKWKNIPNQIKLLELLITNKEISENSIFSLKNYQGQKIRKEIELKAYTSSKNHYLIENWRNIKLIETLLIISEGDNYPVVKQIFDWALKNIPEIIILGLLNIKIDYNENILMKELLIDILSSILYDKNPRAKLIDEIWQTSKDAVIFSLYNSWKNSPDLMNLSLIFDLSNSLLKDSLLPLVNSKYHNFSVHLALLASKRDYLHIEQWIKKSIEKYGDVFINSLLDYLKINIIQPCQMNLNINQKENNKASILEKAQLSLESLSIILNTLNSYNIQNENNNININDKLSIQTKKEIEEINKIIFDIYDEIQDEQINSDEIEKEVSQLLRNMLDEKITVDKIINILIKYKLSNDKRQNEIFSCLIHGILDEYRFYGQYPKNKLKIMSELFGKIINNKLIEGIIETLALKYIFEGIKTGSGLLHFFGINALTQFVGKISHWPSYMKSLLDLEQIKQNKNLYILILQENEKSQKKNISDKSAENSDKYIPLISISQSENKSIEENINSNTNASINNEIINSANKSKDSKAKEIENVDKLKDKLSGVTKSFIDYDYNSDQNNNFEGKLEIPNDEIINKSKIIFDSLNKNNIFEKAIELSNLLGNEEKTIRWFSYYFITTKINYGKKIPFQIYYDLFNYINNPILSKYILKDTIKYIQELLSLDYLYIDDKCKNILKNLGTWLGFNTLPKNKPILAKDIDFRELITTSYKKGELNTIIPFICKVFYFITKSKIFNINNPWINSILSLLKEIYHKSLLSFVLKNEIESFFELIKIEMSSISNSTKYLTKISRLESKNHDFPDSQKYQINIDKKDLTKKISSLNDYINNLSNILNNDKNSVSGFYYNNKNFNYFNNLIESESGDNENYLSCNNHKSIDNQKELISILTNIMNQSILETIPDLVQLCIERPINSAIAIVNKDFIFERDVNKYKTALDNTLQFFLKSFSVMEGHMKLKRNIDSNLEKYYKAKQLEKETINKIKELPNNEYVNIGFEYIQKFIVKEALNKLSFNKQVLEEIDKRKNGNFNIVKNDYYKEYKKAKNKMPKILKPNEENIKDNEFKIYENFKTNGFKLFEEDIDISSFLNTVYRILKEVIDKAGGDNSPNKTSTYKNYDLCMKNIQNISKKNAFCNYDEEQQLICLKKIIVDSKINEIEICTQLAENTFKYIIDSIKINNYLLLNAYINILRGWVKLHNEIANKITEYLFEYDIDIFTKFKYELHLYLIKQKILNQHLYDNYMIKLLTGSSVINVIIQNLLNHLFASNNNKANNNINQKNSSYKINPYYYDKNSEDYYLLFNRGSSILCSFYSKYLIAKIVENNINDEKNVINSYILPFINIIENFINSIFNLENNTNEILQKENCLSGEENLKYFFKEIYELCINNIYQKQFVKYINYFYPENISIFIFQIIKIIDNENNRFELFNYFLNFIINSFHQDYILNTINFNQKKYYKIFINLIYLMTNKLDNNDNKDNLLNKMNYLSLICDTFKILSPMNYPGFALAWLDLISFHDFIDNFLDVNLVKEDSNKYEKYLSLLTEILSYLNKLKNKIINFYYLKVILDKIYRFFFILSNTYPSFVTSYSYILLSYLPISSSPDDEDNNSFLQLRNIILSATPSNFIDGVNNIKELTQNYYKENILNSKVFKDNLICNKIVYLLFDNDESNENIKDRELNILLDKYINEKNDDNNLENILNYLDIIKDERELYNIYNGIMLYWCLKKHEQLFENKIQNQKIFYNFYFFLLSNLNEIHKKYLIDSILNALRFPCSQTFNYSILFQELYVNLENEDIEKQLMVNILERMLYKPIPWGIKYTLKSLFNNVKYKQLEKNYINQNDEIVDFINKISNCSLENDISLKNNI